MCMNRRISVVLGLSAFLLVTCPSAPRAATGLTTVNGSQGGMIIYGLVDGATSPAAAMAKVLNNVKSGCGDKPQVGKVFRVKNSNSNAVFFTVTNKSQGNVPVAGMLLATQTGPNTVEAGMVSDTAARFNSTVNPLLQQLFSVWHPAGAVPAAAGKGTAPGGAGGGNVALPPMQQVSLPDGSATFRLPAGWNIGPRSGGGSASVNGPQGEAVAMMYYVQAIDPRGQTYQKDMQMRFRPPHTVFLLSDADMVKNFPAIWQAIRASAGLGPAPMTVDKVDPVPGSQQGQCVAATGQINGDGRGMKEMWTMLCRAPVDQWGDYGFTTSQYQLPLGASAQQRATSQAIISSYQVNMQRVQAMSNAQLAPAMAAFQQNQNALMSFTQAQIAHTKQIGAEATARMNATEAANQQQWAGFDKQEENISRQGQGFSNYLLDQTVVQNNNVAGTGLVGHATLWNTEADALVKSDPNKYEYVPVPNYWRGTDFQP